MRTEFASVQTRLLEQLCKSSGLLLLFASCMTATASVHAQNGGASVLSIRLEKKAGDAVRSVPQNTVFRNGDVLRFRLTSQIDGYLYVVDRGSTGNTAVLFPAAPTAGGNRIETGRSYLVPAEGDGWFEVSGPAGFDVLYFLVSATPISLPSGSSPNQGNEHAPTHESSPPPNLLPRCDDAVFKARGECVDTSAGAAPLPPDAAVPRELVPLAHTASRDIVLTDDGDDTAVHSAPNSKLPIIYTFRLAHRE